MGNALAQPGEVMGNKIWERVLKDVVVGRELVCVCSRALGAQDLGNQEVWSHQGSDLSMASKLHFCPLIEVCSFLS